MFNLMVNSIVLITFSAESAFNIALLSFITVKFNHYYIINPENRVGVPASHVCERSVADQPGLVRQIFPAFCLLPLHLLTVTDTLCSCSCPCLSPPPVNLPDNRNSAGDTEPRSNVSCLPILHFRINNFRTQLGYFIFVFS